MTKAQGQVPENWIRRWTWNPFEHSPVLRLRQHQATESAAARYWFSSTFLHKPLQFGPSLRQPWHPKENADEVRPDKSHRLFVRVRRLRLVAQVSDGLPGENVQRFCGNPTYRGWIEVQMRRDHLGRQAP
jgi:hypothetical protein